MRERALAIKCPQKTLGRRTTGKLDDDWQGSDFHSRFIRIGTTTLKVQLKARAGHQQEIPQVRTCASAATLIARCTLKHD